MTPPATFAGKRPAWLIAAAVVAVLMATVFPFLPGRYDALAAPLSLVARILGVGSLLLVPIGMAWLAYELLGASDRPRPARTRFLGAARVVMSIVVVLALTGAASMFVMSLGVIALACWLLFLWRHTGSLLAWAREDVGRAVRPALAMIVVPMLTAGAIAGMAAPLQRWSQHRTMDATQRLIDDIERYRVAHGTYPRALFTEWMDYRAEIIGVRGYQYEPVDNTYSIAVEIPAFDPAARAYLMYNPNDVFRMPSHDEWPLTWTDGQLQNHRGYAWSRDAGRAHWRILYFD